MGAFIGIGIFALGLILTYPQQASAVFITAGVLVAIKLSAEFYQSYAPEREQRRRDREREKNTKAVEAQRQRNLKFTEDQFIRVLASPLFQSHPIIEDALRAHFKADQNSLIGFGCEYKDYVAHWKDGLARFETNLQTLPSPGLFTLTSSPRLPDQWHEFIKPVKPLDDGLRLVAHEFFPNSLDIPRERWFEGTWIVAAQGRGKTNLLRHIILHFLKEPCCIILMDAKAQGDLINSFNRLQALKNKLVVLEPSVEYPLAINPLTLGHEFLEYVFASFLESKLTGNQATLFRMVGLLCKQIPKANLRTFRDILQNDWNAYETQVRELDPEDQEFFDHEWNAKAYVENRGWVLSRIRSLLATPSMRSILRSTETKLDMSKLINTPHFVCIDNSVEKLGEQGAEFFGRLLISLIWAAAKRRPHNAIPVYFFIDEAHFAIGRDPTIATIIDQCRAARIALIASHQRLSQIQPEVQAALNNCAIKFANSTGEHKELASRLHTDADFIRQQKRGQFACYVVDKTDAAVSLTVPPVDMSQYPTMTRGEYDTVLARSRKFCQTPHEPSAKPSQRGYTSSPPSPKDEFEDF